MILSAVCFCVSCADITSCLLQFVYRWIISSACAMTPAGDIKTMLYLPVLDNTAFSLQLK